jgi:glycosyltransferase involved in cell wall biosynthesis
MSTSIRAAIFSHSDSVGGGPRAAYRIHSALREAGIHSTMYVNQAALGDWTVKDPATTLAKLQAKLYSGLGGVLGRLIKTNRATHHSFACLPTSWASKINTSNTDLVHLHWINGEMLSIADLGKIRKPIVWTLHDMWAFSGAEHYQNDEHDARWRQGYFKHNRTSGESGFDWNRWVWQRKQKHWQALANKRIHIVTPSRWLTQCAAESALMKNWQVHVVPNPLNTDIWQPADKSTARALLHLPQAKPLLLFGAIGGSVDPRKGFDLLQAALVHLRGKVFGLELIIFGELAPKEPIDLGFRVHYMGQVQDDVTLRLLYSAADVMVVPSRQEAFGQTASEALACGTPVAAFDATGLKDVLEHQVSGYLAKPFEASDLATGIEWLFNQLSLSDALNLAARKRALELFSYPAVARQYAAIYASAMQDFGRAAT